MEVCSVLILFTLSVSGYDVNFYTTETKDLSVSNYANGCLFANDTRQSTMRLDRKGGFYDPNLDTINVRWQDGDLSKIIGHEICHRQIHREGLEIPFLYNLLYGSKAEEAYCDVQGDNMKLRNILGGI